MLELHLPTASESDSVLVGLASAAEGGRDAVVLPHLGPPLKGRSAETRSLPKDAHRPHASPAHVLVHLLTDLSACADITRKRALGLTQLLATYIIFQALHHLNSMLAFRLNGFDFDTLPLQVFAPKEQVARQSSSIRRPALPTATAVQLRSDPAQKHDPAQLRPIKLASPRASQVVTWFLLSLLIWRTMLPVVVTLRAPIATTFVIAHLALFLDLGLNYQNLLSFMPCAAPPPPERVSFSHHLTFSASCIIACVKPNQRVGRCVGGNAPCEGVLQPRRAAHEAGFVPRGLVPRGRLTLCN